MNHEAVTPNDNDPDESAEAFRIEKPGGYTEEDIERHTELYERSYGLKGEGWQLEDGVIIVTAEGLREYDRRESLEDER